MALPDAVAMGQLEVLCTPHGPQAALSLAGQVATALPRAGGAHHGGPVSHSTQVMGKPMSGPGQLVSLCRSCEVLCAFLNYQWCWQWDLLSYLQAAWAGGGEHLVRLKSFSKEREVSAEAPPEREEIPKYPLGARVEAASCFFQLRAKPFFWKKGGG